MDDVNEELLEMVEQMPAFPKSVKRVIELSSDINCDHKDLVRVIEHDPVMTLKVLNLVNSAYFGLSREISSINHAVVYVGLNTVKNLAISIASIGMLPSENGAGMNMERFLYHSVSTASLARLLSKQMGVSEKEGSDYFVTGLLHDFGKIVFAQYMSGKYKKVLQLEQQKIKTLTRAEKEVIGVDHTSVGEMLGKKWSLSDSIIEGIKMHHQDNFLNNDGNNLLVNIIYIANRVSKELQENEDDESFSKELLQAVSTRFGNRIDRCIASPKSLMDEVKGTLQYMRL